MKNLQKVKYHMATALASLAVLVGTLTANSFCWLEYYQPKAPEKLIAKN